MIVIFLVFAGILGTLWVGARDVAAGTMTPGELAQFVIYAVIVAGSVGALSEIWSELQRAAGATERLVELLTPSTRCWTRFRPAHAAPSVARRGAVRRCHLHLPHPPR